MYSTKIEPKYNLNPNPRIGLIALASDFMIEKDFINVIKDKDIDFFVNRIECYNPLTKENLIKMSEKVTEVTNDILPDQEIDCVVYACTSGTIAAGHDSIEKKVRLAKPSAKVITPSTAAIKALKKFNVKNLEEGYIPSILFSNVYYCYVVFYVFENNLCNKQVGRLLV